MIKKSRRNSFFKRHHYLRMVGLLVFSYWVAAAFVLLVDPYDIYDWGIETKLKAERYNPNAAPNLVNIVVKDPSYHTLLIGGSTAVGFETEKISKIVGDNKPAYNLSYSLPLPLDQLYIQNLVLSHSKAKHIIMSIDWTAMLPPKLVNFQLPVYLLNESPWDDLRMVNLSNLIRAVRVFQSGTLDESSWSWKTYERIVNNTEKSFDKYFTDDVITSVVEKYRPIIDAPSDASCDEFPTISQSIVPFVKAASDKGIKVDMIFSSISHFEYYVLAERKWMDLLLQSKHTEISTLSSHLAMRKCVVEAIANVSSARVFAFDNEAWITGNLSNFYDAIHLHPNKQNIYDFMLHAIAEGSHQLTVDNITAHSAELLSSVKNYDPKSSYPSGGEPIKRFSLTPKSATFDTSPNQHRYQDNHQSLAINEG